MRQRLSVFAVLFVLLALVVPAVRESLSPPLVLAGPFVAHGSQQGIPPRAVISRSPLMAAPGGGLAPRASAPTAEGMAPAVQSMGDAAAAPGSGPEVREPVQNDVSQSLISMPLIPPARVDRDEEEMPNGRLPQRLSQLALAGAQAAFVDPALQTTIGAGTMPAPSVNFEGLTSLSKLLPPDPNAAVGPDHILEMVNVSFAVYNKLGGRLYGPAAISTAWQGFGGPCENNNDGDPIVVYDQLADRWLISQFAMPNFHPPTPQGPFYQCIAISSTPDPTGSWYRYQYLYSNTTMNDYFKIGIWPDGYYMSTNQFGLSNNSLGAGAVVFERSQMLIGNPSARMVYFNLPSLGGMLPSSLDGQAPPAGTPNYFAEVDDVASGKSPDQFQLWACHVDWSNTANSTFTQSAVLATTAFDANMCGVAVNCIPQPGGAPGLDAISDRLMYRLQYRNLGNYQAMVVNHTVDVDGLNHAGIRWYELRNSGQGWGIYQQGTYAPGDGNQRWMGSIAMDQSGNLALGYSVSSASMDPSIRYTGRLKGDPLGQMARSEMTLIPGGGHQSDPSGRWGDYSSMAVDPADGCTFWYTQEYYGATSGAAWQTRIGSFRFPWCGLPARAFLPFLAR